METNTAVVGAPPQWEQTLRGNRALSWVPHVMTYGLGTGQVSAFFRFFSGLFWGVLGGRIHVIGGSSQVPQILPQLLPCPVDVGLHSAKRELHDLRDLVVRVVLYVAEDDASAILGPQARDCFLDRCAKLLRLELLER